jgi:hypothetical protein
MKLKKLFALLFVLLTGLSLASCNSGPKAKVAYEKLEECKEFCEMKLELGEGDTIEYKSIKFVEITNDDMVASIIGNVYYDITYTITYKDGTTKSGSIYPEYEYSENAFYYWENFSKDSYKEYYTRVEYEMSDGVIGQID